MNEDDERRHRSAEPAWPTDEDHRKRREEPQERTGFWSPLWDDEDGGAPQGGGSHRQSASPAKPAPSAKPAWPTDEPADGARTRHVPAPPPGTPQRPGGPPGRAGARPPGRPGGPPPGGSAEGPTVMLPKTDTGPRPEPALLTHREPALGMDDDPRDPYGPESRELPALSADDKRLRRRRIWRRIRRTAYAGVALMIIVPIVGFFIAYQTVTVPSPQDVAANEGQAVTLKWANGKEMTKIAPPGSNRKLVTFDEIPENVRHAVYAAEDSSFETNAGFDITGILAAAYNQVTGGTGGGSTITQQYIKKASEHEEHTLTRKALEVVKAYKMSKTYDKKQIITAYLNTIYFGRGANGIQAAAQAYFNKDVGKLTTPEAAVLAGMIQGPSRSGDAAYVKRRWTYVMDQMVKNGWLSPAERQSAQLPKMVDRDKSKKAALTGDMALIQKRALQEVELRLNLTEDEIQQRGLTIQTTIDPTAQKYAEQSVKEVMQNEPKNLRPALVAVDPNNGEIKAYYGGKEAYDYAWAIQEPGSSFKPFDLVALLKQGKGLGETYDGRDGRTFPGRPNPVHNAGPGSSCGQQCTVAEAMKRSVNTVFYDMVLNTTGDNAVVDAAFEAGVAKEIPWTQNDNGTYNKKQLLDQPDGNISIGGGKTQVRTVDMANAYATFANGGLRHTPHIVSKVFDSEGQIVYQTPTDGQPAFAPDNLGLNSQIARNVTESLLPIPKWSKIPCDEPHQCAGKTGTQQFQDGNSAANAHQDAKAWMVGYTPSISTAVSMTAQKNEPIVNKEGNPIYGSGLPGHIWQSFMNKYLANKTNEAPWPPFEPIGKPASEVPGSTYGATPTSSNPPHSSDTTTTTTRKHGGGHGGGGGGGGSTTTTTSREPCGFLGCTTEPTEPGPGGGGGGTGPGNIRPTT